MYGQVPEQILLVTEMEVSLPTSKPPSLPPQTPVHPLILYRQTLLQGRLPNKLTIISAIKACTIVSALTQAKNIHAHIIKTGYKFDRFLATSLVQFYSHCGSLDSARHLFDQINDKDPALQTAMLVGHMRNGSIVCGRALFDEMSDRDVIAWNALLSGYEQSGLPRDALHLFREMQIAGFEPNQVTLLSALSACSQLGCLSTGEWIHAYIQRAPHIIVTPKLNNSLMHMYAKCGRLDAAFNVFLDMRPRNLESWNTMLTSFAFHGRTIDAISLFAQLMKTGVMPDRVTFIALLTACSHGGMVDHAKRCFDCMSRVYGFKPKAEHYGCMVDVLSRNGSLEEAYRLMESIPFEPDIYMWGALLSGCQIHGNYKFGLDVAKRVLELDPGEEGRYIALANLYAKAGRGEDAIDVRKKMMEMGMKKYTGGSMIEVDGEVHEFLAGDSINADIFDD